MSRFSVATSLAEMLGGELRLDATFYTSSVYTARKILDDYGDVGSIGELSEGTFNPPPIKRIYTDNIDIGTPYMLPQEMFDFYWAPKKYVLSNKMDKIKDWFLKRGWIVLTQSGSVGKPYFATAADEKVVLSQNAIRIPPKSIKTAGYIYAFLSTWIGQTLLKKDEFGITVKHIRPHHVDAIPIPRIPRRMQEDISKKVEEAFEMRSKSIALLNEAKRIIYDELGAPTVAPSVEEEDSENETE
jgi:type I restriction enzyme S subunit